MFLSSRDKSLNMLKLIGTINENEITRMKEKHRECSCCGIRLQFAKYLIWPRNERVFFVKSVFVFGYRLYQTIVAYQGKLLEKRNHNLVGLSFLVTCLLTGGGNNGE